MVQAWRMVRVSGLGRHAGAFGMALCAATILSGCAASGGQGFSAFASTGSAAPQQARTVSLFVASTRPSTRSGEGEAASTATLSLVQVSIPPGHSPGQIERPRLGSENRKSHFVIVGQRAIDKDEFRQDLATQLSGRVGVSRDVLVFVHGFNTGYDEARFRLAQIAVDSRFSGVPVLFTWPSRNRILAYGSDKESATASRDALEEVLSRIAATPGVGKVHILAHSMGTWLTMETLRQGAIAGKADLDGRLGEVMLAAPDIDLDVFRAQMSRVKGAARVSILSASDDRALSISGALAGDRTRLGALDLKNPAHVKAVADLGVTVYDLSGSDDSDFFRHATFAQAPGVVRTIGAHLALPRIEDGQAQSQAFVDEDTIKAADAQARNQAVVTEPLPPPDAPVQP